MHMGFNAPHRLSRVQRPFTSSVCNPSAESGLASTCRSVPSSVYVEDDSDRGGKSWLNMTRELNRFHGYHESRTTLLLSVDLVGLDLRLF
ncbi:hypothetical protein CRG98_002700 [Punica granatum]|uniref:Uncharacterized protein n=1 Tax=Punica granatum TaxID=22663 RepID=A0A2I0L8F0_PUNGR|nr:hypothetical protein CRG98_002700 [Punica granatum]